MGEMIWQWFYPLRGVLGDKELGEEIMTKIRFNREGE